MEAKLYARQLGCDVWEFAVDIGSFHRAGLSNNDLRWLVLNGVLEHAVELTDSGQPSRVFRRDAKHLDPERSCFVLTEQGLQIAAQTSYLERIAQQLEQTSRPSPVLPKWDGIRRELRFSGSLVKRYRVPAENQALILEAFEEEGWPPHLDDPLPPQLGIDTKRRLHDTITRLNRNQIQKLLRFFGDGTGRGLGWKPVLGV